jgi:hypothetical protein
MVKGVIEAIIETFINMTKTNLEILMLTLWLFFAGYATWYLTSAKRYAPLTFHEADILWRIHKQSIRCKATKWREIKRRGKIVGFECECGYRHIQKCPITVSAPENSVLDKLHTTYKS